MKWAVLATLLCLAPSMPAHAIRIPPGGGCCPSCVCTVSPQLIVVPAYFPLDTQTDPTQPTDWNRIKNAGSWVGLIVADAIFETASGAQTDLHNAPTTQKMYGYV